MENKEPIIDDVTKVYKTSNGFTCVSTIFVKKKPKTKIELWAELFSLLDGRIQNMPEEEYQEYKKSKRIF